MRTLVLSILLLLCFPALVFGQPQTTGRVTGTVVDEEGNPVAGARVTFISSALQGERVVETADNGDFLAALLPVGPYSVEVVAPEMQPVSVSFRLGVGQTVPLDINLEKGGAPVEEVTIHATAAPSATTVLGQSFDYARSVEELPIQDRSINSITTYAPNVAPSPGAGPISISGAPSFDNLTLLDGSEISDPYLSTATTIYLEDAIEEVQVMTAGVSARYGRFQGGVINAITKTGGNTFDGMFRAEFSKQSWNSQTPFEEEQSDQLNDAYQVTLGGYMLKDHLWFFLGARTQSFAADSSVVISIPGGGAPGLTTDDQEDRWQFKLRGAITSDHVIELNYLNYERSVTDTTFFPAGNILAANGFREDPREIFAGVYQGVLTPNLFLDLQATSKRVSVRAGPDPSRSDASPFFDFSVGAVFNNQWYDPNDPSVLDNDTLGLNLTQAISTSRWGSHAIEYGAQYVRSTTSGGNGQSVTGFNMLPIPLGFTNFAIPTPDPTVTLYNINSFVAGTGAADMYIYRWEALAREGEREIANLAVYVQDTWQVDKWRFDIGLRYDDYDGSGPQTTQNFDFDEIAPRLGVTYNINRNWQIQATWGRYVSRFNDAIFGSVTGGFSYVQSVYTGPEFTGQDAATMESVLRDTHPACVNNSPGGGLPDGTCWGVVNFVRDANQPTQFLESGVTAPYADDFNLSARYALPRNSGSLVLALIDRRFERLLDDFVGGYGFTTVTDPIPPDPNNPESFTFDTLWWANADQAERRYTAATLVADWRPAPNWGIGGNYTYSQAEGNYDDTGVPDSGTQIGDWVESRPESAAVPDGLLNTDITHRLRGWGTYRWNFDRAGQFVLGSVLTYESGPTWSRVASVALDDYPGYVNDLGSYTHYFGDRGSDRFGDWWRLDLSARYQFPIWKRFQGWLKVDVLNLTDENAVVSYSTSASAVTDVSGNLVWVPNGNCGPGKNPWPSTSCSAFGRIRTERDYQQPRTYLITFGLTF